MPGPSATDTVVDVQFSAGAADWPLLLEATLAAESAGFGAVWVFDHLAGRSLRGDGMLECFTWLGALAAATSRIALGSLVTNVWNREPGVLAVAAASVEHISARPFYLGLGAGASPTSAFAAEQRAVGARIGRSVAERHERVVATLQLLDAMWEQDRAEHFDTFPLPRRRPVTVVGVNSVALAEVAGRCADGINVFWGHPRRDELLAAADAARPPERPPLLTTAYASWDDDLVDPDHPTRRQMASAGIGRLVLSDVRRPDPDRIASLSP
jgi:alkanesulfonate monooxygenase SsuD/methylene tetrahydromethanopterin reductase-like flavin-dependent oxidoreductase (luciferase family)